MTYCNCQHSPCEHTPKTATEVECCGQPSFCEKPCFHDSGRSTPGRAGAVAGVGEDMQTISLRLPVQIVSYIEMLARHEGRTMAEVAADILDLSKMPLPLSVARARREQIGGDHYVTKAIQPWDAMQSWMTPEQFEGFLRGSAIKYIARYREKGGIEDVRKAQHYLQRLAEHLEAGE